MPETAGGATLDPGATPMSPEALVNFSFVSRETLQRLKTYANLLVRWQDRMNLVSRASLADLWRRHMLDSAQLAPLLPSEGCVMTDLGSGAGFPGLVLAIVSGAETHLVEANARKCAFLREAVRVTDAPATVHQARLESVAPWPTDIIVARALAPVGELLGFAARFHSGDGQIGPICHFLKGENVSMELTEARKAWHMEAHLADSLSDPSGRILTIRKFSRVT